VVRVETDERFQPDIGRIKAAITPRTKAIILNSPNNPTGAVYGEKVLRELDGIIREPMLAISDEPYRPIAFDGVQPPETLKFIERSVLAWSWSKAMALAGERIGCLAIPPRLAEAEPLRQACIFAHRVLGYVNAPALWQLVVAEAPDAIVDAALYQARRNLLCDALTAMGYDAPRPQGAFYVFPRTPIPDDLAFMGVLQQEGILAVPGVGFGRGGYMRLSLTTSTREIERSLPGFERAIRKCR
jgi:aspartate aminotransferase